MRAICRSRLAISCSSLLVDPCGRRAAPGQAAQRSLGLRGALEVETNPDPELEHERPNPPPGRLFPRGLHHVESSGEGSVDCTDRDVLAALSLATASRQPGSASMTSLKQPFSAGLQQKVFRQRERLRTWHSCTEVTSRRAYRARGNRLVEVVKSAEPHER